MPTEPQSRSPFTHNSKSARSLSTRRCGSPLRVVHIHIYIPRIRHHHLMWGAVVCHTHIHQQYQIHRASDVVPTRARSTKRHPIYTSRSLHYNTKTCANRVSWPSISQAPQVDRPSFRFVVVVVAVVVRSLRSSSSSSSLCDI